MGCTASKLDHEDTVRRCKERRRLMKAAVYSRHHLAAAHYDYCRSLRLTGAALATFGAGEPLSVYDHAPAVLLRTPSSLSTADPPTPPPRHPPHNTIPPPSPSPSPSPPPPPTNPTPRFSPSISSSKLPHILSASSNQNRRRKKQLKLPHILSDSSFPSSPNLAKETNGDYTYNAKANSTYSTTPSQASSVWNWENFYPPSPPDSEYFDQLKNKKNNFNAAKRSQSRCEDEEEDKRSRFSSYSRKDESHYRKNHLDSGSVDKEFDFFDDDRMSDYSSRNGKGSVGKPGGFRKGGENPHHLNRWESGEEDGGETEREEVQCSEWGDHDHYSTTSSSDEDEEGEESLRSHGVGSQSNMEGSVGAANKSGNLSDKVGFVKGGVNFQSKLEKLSSSDDGGSTMSWGDNGKGEGEMVSDTRIVVRHKDLAEIVGAIKEYFDKAASAGDQVSEMLETGRAQLDQSFSKLKSGLF